MKKLLCFSILILVIVFMPSLSVNAAKTMYAASVNGQVPIHISPDENSFTVAVMPSCAEMELISQQGTWGLVNYNKKSGWINLSFAGKSYEQAANLTGYECARNVITRSDIKQTPLYTLPSQDEKTGSEKKYGVPAGTVIKITRETADGWALVEMNSDFVWIQLENTEPFITETEEVVSKYEIYYVYTLSKTGKGAKIYSKSDGKTVLKTVQDCIKLTVREENGDYAYVSYDGVNGWIRLEDVTESLSNAQNNTGEEINREYEVVDSGENDVIIYNVPSEEITNGAVSEGKVSGKERIFVQRSTYDGWLLINHNGDMGWIPPGSAAPVAEEEKESLEILKEFEKGYISTSENEGAEVFASYDGKNAFTVIPECVSVEVVCNKGDYRYVMCDYAAGWVQKDSLTDEYKDAVNRNVRKQGRSYIAKKGAQLMSLPTDSELCGSEKILNINPGTQIEVVRVVISDKTKWALTEVDGKQGWVNLAGIRKRVTMVDILVLTLIVLMSATVCVCIIIILRKKIKERRQKKDESEEVL